MAAGPSVTICDVGPRTASRTSRTSSPRKCARSSSTDSWCGPPAGRGRELRRPPTRPADGGGGGGRERARPETGRRLRRPRAQRARVREARRRRARRGPVRVRSDRVVQPQEPERSVRTRSSRRPDRRARRADGLRVGITISVAFGCPFEGVVDETACSSSRYASRSAPRHASPRRHDRGRHAAPGSPARRVRVETRRPGRRPLPQHAKHRLCERGRRARSRGDSSRRVRRRPRRMSVRAQGNGEHRHRGSRLPPPRRRDRDGNRPGRAPARVGVARERPRAAARGPGLPRQRLSARRLTQSRVSPRHRAQAENFDRHEVGHRYL